MAIFEQPIYQKYIRKFSPEYIAIVEEDIVPTVGVDSGIYQEKEAQIEKLKQEKQELEKTLQEKESLSRESQTRI
jgi:fructose-bisphosphate aldolase class 1